MRPVNLLPEEQRGRGVPTGDPTISYGIIGALGLLLLMVLFTIMQSNKAATLTNEAEELRAQATKYQTQAAPVVKYSDFGSEVDKRKLIIGGLAESRFPWHSALFNLSQAVPKDVTIDSLLGETTAADTAAAAPAAAAAPDTNEEKPGATIKMTGCASGWITYAKFASRLKTMPGVLSVHIGDSGDEGSSDGSPPVGDSGAAGDDSARHLNCGRSPLRFGIDINYRLIPIDLVGLPKVAAPDAGASGATGSAAAPTAGTGGAPAAATSTGAR